MLTVDNYGRIRRAHRDGMSIREIAIQFHHSRHKVREILHGGGEPSGYRQRSVQAAPKLGPVTDRMLEILKSDEMAPPKQRHTAQRLFERLRDEHGYTGGYDAIRRFVKRHRAKQRETFIPLDHAHGRRMEADFGKIYVDFPEGRRQVSVLILVWSCSNAPFAMALPTERTEAILEGMRQAFEFFGCVPREVWWDNPKTVAETLLTGRDRKLNPRYAAFASHYVFDPLFCMPASGNEKPVVENRVKTLQRRWSTPVPSMQSMHELNEYLRQCCANDQSRPATTAGMMASSPPVSESSTGAPDEGSVAPTFTIGDVLNLDVQQSAPLPRHSFEACVRQPAMVDKYQMVRFDNVGYSVPRNVAFEAVTVKGFIDRVEIVHQDTVVATHARSYGKNQEILDPRHYLITLGHRPGALDHSRVLRDWELPEAFTLLRTRLEERHGLRSGVRHFVRVLQLLSDYSVTQVAAAIEQLRDAHGADADRIIRRVESSALRHNESQLTDLHGLVRSDVTNVTVPNSGLAHFDSLLPGAATMAAHSSQGSSHDEAINPITRSAGNTAAEVESQTPETADDRPGISETGTRSGRIEPDIRTIPAATDGTGTGSSSVERAAGPHEAGQSAGGEGSGHLRLLGNPRTEQAEDPGTGTRRMDHETLECVPVGSAGYR